MQKAVLNFRNRKIGKIHHTFIVSLPPDVIRSWKIGKGDLVSISLQKDGSLKLKPVESREKHMEDSK
jgi:phosphate uptake regulator